MHTIRQHIRLLAFTFPLVFSVILSSKTMAQSGCPGCIVNLPVLPADTIYLGTTPDGVAGEYYDADMSFRMPKTTTPVNATDPSTPAGLPISNITIVAVVNVPPGLSWEANQTSFNPSNQTDGCVKFCGTPLQPGTYNVEVFVTATVLTLSQSTSFSFPIIIAPANSSSEGFTMFNNSGCGEVTVSFLNNLPSNGLQGYTYNWDFGNGTTSALENPPPVIYDEPGVYEVNYSANIDTFGYEVTTVRVLNTGCDDAVFNIPPDLYLKVKDPLGNLIVTTNIQDNVSFPAIFNINLPLTDGIYELEVRDDDTFGSESCGYVYFTKTNTGTLVSGELEVQVDIIHPVTTLQSTGTVTVYEKPTAPVIMPNGTVDLCDGEEIELVADYDQNLQWYQDTTVLFGEIGQSLQIDHAGQFWLEYTSLDGCKAQSEVVEVNLLPLPNAPTFTVTGNEYAVANPDLLPADYSLQWYMDGNLLPGETGSVYCLMQPGVFLMTLEVTDNTTGCANEFSLGVSFNAAYTCASASNEISALAGSLVLAPNPTNGHLVADFMLKKPGAIVFQVFDNLGRLVMQQQQISNDTHVRHEMQLGELINGTYFLKVQTDDGVISGRIVKQ
jgi:Secretion system C-terminal sorting domain